MHIVKNFSFNLSFEGLRLALLRAERDAFVIVRAAPSLLRLAAFAKVRASSLFGICERKENPRLLSSQAGPEIVQLRVASHDLETYDCQGDAALVSVPWSQNENSIR
jgi:hypothetical protein